MIKLLANKSTYHRLCQIRESYDCRRFRINPMDRKRIMVSTERIFTIPVQDDELSTQSLHLHVFSNTRRPTKLVLSIVIAMIARVQVLANKKKQQQCKQQQHRQQGRKNTAT